MSWSLHRWAWLIEAPLFVGAPPAGSLNRCRPYVLARGIWGALTSKSAQAGANGFPDYRRQGKTLRECARFTYLYPAARVNGAWHAWLPEYVWARGLVWRREDNTSESVGDRPFRRWIIDARPGTAIDADSDTAAEATLRETECVMTNWRAGSPSGGEPVALVGYVFLKDMPAGDLETATTLFIGGDTRYGLGHLRRVEFAEADTVFGARPMLDGSEPQVSSSRLLGHAISKREVYGAKEAMTMWDRTAADPLVSVGTPRWVPGSRTYEDVAWTIDSEGTWVDTNGYPPTR
jgi:hypothetical protein